MNNPATLEKIKDFKALCAREGITYKEVCEESGLNYDSVRVNMNRNLLSNDRIDLLIETANRIKKDQLKIQ